MPEILKQIHNDKKVPLNLLILLIAF